MGIPMDIHAPTVTGASGAQNGSSADSGAQLSSRDKLLELMKRKDDLESELSALGSVLDSHGVNMQTSLLTFDGYPRDDIDVAQIRTTRARIIHLRNDHKSLVDEIEKGLHAHHRSLSSSSAGRTGGTALAESSRAPVAIVEAQFAVVGSVAESSPADTAGLKVGDKVKRFGNIGAMNHEKLSKLSSEVQQNEGKPIRVLLDRIVDDRETSLEVSLIPRRDWGGRGMLGCQLLPL